MDKRWCNRCQQEKELDQFPKNRIKKLGHGYTCKSCEAKFNRIRDRIRDKTPERIAKSKAWLQSERGKELYKERIIRNKERYKANRMIRKLINIGIISKASCVVCGDLNSKGHHPDYSKPLEVIWLCQKHHSEIHRK